MIKKKMSIPYLPARIVKGASRWYIVYYQTNPVSGQRERFRETFDLNRIKSARDRRITAQLLIKQINSKLPFGYPFDEFIGSGQDIIKALEDAIEIKKKVASRESLFRYTSVKKILSEFFQHHKLKNVSVDAFDNAMANRFLKWVMVHRGVSAVTRNNYCNLLKSMLNEVLPSGENPFTNIKQLKPKPKKRRTIDEKEADLIIKRISKVDKSLTLTILLLYHCFIRPAEQRRLKIGDFDLVNNRIRIGADQSKNKKASNVIIPDAIISELKRWNIDSINKDWYLFGRKGFPSNTQMGKNSMYNRHREIIEDLEKEKIISGISGLTLYSWKDAGVINMVKSGINVRDIQRQLRHSSLEETQKYLNSMTFTSDDIQNAAGLL